MIPRAPFTFPRDAGQGSLVTPAASFAQDAAKPAPDNRVRKANYDLASRWTAAKVGKMVFDTAVTPRWLESGEVGRVQNIISE